MVFYNQTELQQQAEEVCPRCKSKDIEFCYDSGVWVMSYCKKCGEVL